MQLAVSAPFAFEPGSAVARIKRLDIDWSTSVHAGAPLEGPTTYATRQSAFAAAYAASLGDDHGAVLVARRGSQYLLQHALLPADQDAAAMPLKFEHLVAGQRPIAPRGGFPPALAAIIDGAAIIVPRD